MAEARTAHDAPVSSRGVEHDLELLMVSGINDLSAKASPSVGALPPQSGDGDVRARDEAQSLQASAANDDFVALDAHLRLLKQQGSRQPEWRALVFTSLIAFSIGELLAHSSEGMRLSWPTMLAVTFLSAVTLFFVIATALRQRTTQATLTTLLRTTSHLAQPEIVERERFALLSEHVRADIAALDRSVARTSNNLNKTVDAMNSKLGSYEQSLASVGSKADESFEKLSIERAAIVTNSENLRHALLGVSSDISKDLASIAGNLQLIFQSKTEGLIEVIDQRNKEFIHQYLDAEEKITLSFKNLLDKALVKAADRFEMNNDRFLAALSRRQEDFDEKLDRHMREAFAKADHQISSLFVKTDALAANTSRQVEELLARAETATEQRSTALRTMLATAIIDLSQSFRQNTKTLQETIEVSVGEVEKLSGRCQDVSIDLSKQVADFKSAVVEPLNHLTQAFGEKRRTIANDVVLEVTSFSEMMSHAASQVSDYCERETKRFGDRSNESINEIKDYTDRLVAECTASRLRYSKALDLSYAPVPEPAPVPLPLDVPPRSQSSPDIVTDKQQVVVRRKAIFLQETSPRASSFAERYRPAGKAQSWISELLARADAAGLIDQVASPEPQSIEIVQDILIDVDRLIMTSEAVTAWSLFKEDNVANFDNVFTEEGLVAVRSLKRQVDRDAGLYVFFENYLKRVEVLVKEAYAETDEDALLSYMSSENGKTYTLLAYVIERI